MRQSYSNTLVVSASFGLAAYSLSAIVSAERTYTPVFYNSFSHFTWLGFIITIVASVLLILAGNNKNIQTDWRIGFIMLLSAYALFWELPHLLGLRFWAPPVGDLLHHYGFAGYVLDTGEIPPTTVYPAVHVLLATLASVTNISSGAVGSGLSFVSSLIFMLGTACLGGRIFRSKRARVPILAVASVLIYGKFYQHIFPWFISFTLIPFVVFLLVRIRHNMSNLNTKYTLLLISIGVTLFHPMTALVMIGVCIYVFIGEIVASWRLGEDLTTSKAGVAWVGVIPTLHYLWYFGRGNINGHISTIATALTSSVSSAGETAARAQSSGYTPTQLLWRFVILDFGPLLFFCGLAGIVVIVIGYRWLKGESQYGSTIISSIYISGGLLAVVMLLGYFVASGPYRSNQVTIFASILLVGWALYRLHNSQRGTAQNIIRIGLLVSVLLLAVYTPFTVYDERHHINEKEFNGVDWFLDNRELTRPVESHAMTHKTAVYLNNGQLRTGVNWQNWAFSGREPDVARHYGYDERNSIGEIYPDSYVITKSRDFKWWQIEPTNRLDDIPYQTRDDLARLHRDQAADSIYSNGGFSVWSVR